MSKPEELWKPAFYTPRMSPVNRADDIIEFAHRTMTFARGRMAGKPIVFSHWQRWVLQMILEEGHDGNLRYRNLV